MPALLGYMIAIVVTLGGYMVGLHWLLTPPDPFMPDSRAPRLAASHVKHEPSKQKSPLAAVAAETPTSPVPASPSTASAGSSAGGAEAEPPTAGRPAAESARSENEQRLPSPAATSPTTAALTPAAGNASPADRHLAEASSSSQRGSNQEKKAPARKRVAEGRQLQVMILRTYQSADGRRFTRLIPLREAERTRITREIALAPAELESHPFGFW
jgi:hypothetical protein